MNATDWQPIPAELADDAALSRLVEELYRDQYRRWHQDSMTANPALPVTTRALRRIGPWRVMLLLTPWMFTRLFIHDERAPLEVPVGWSANQRGERDDTVIGPAVTFTLFDTPQKAHLNYHHRLGHFLLQPLVMAMEQYATADSVFAAWDEVIRTRDENMKRMQAQCPMQENISRREFLGGLRKSNRSDGPAG